MFHLGRSLAAKLSAARSAYISQSEAFDELSSSIDEVLCSEWLKMVNDFHVDKGMPNPYVPSTKKCKCTGSVHPSGQLLIMTKDRTVQEVRKDLIESERKASPDSEVNISFATFVISGMELEEAQ